MTPVRRASVIGTVPPSLTFDEISADRTFARNTAGVEDIDIDACADVAGDWAPLIVLDAVNLVDPPKNGRDSSGSAWEGRRR